MIAFLSIAPGSVPFPLVLPSTAVKVGPQELSTTHVNQKGQERYLRCM